MEVMKKPVKMTTKQMERIERKKKKICAFLTIARLNDQDRLEKQKQLEAKMGDDNFKNISITTMAGDGPCRKRLKKESENGESFGEKPIEEELSPLATNNFPCPEERYYYNPPAEQPLMYHPFENFHNIYQSYEVYRHHNSETFYYKTNENNCLPKKDLWNENNCPETQKKPLLEGESYVELKKKLSERKKILQNIPRILLRDSGEIASLETDFSDRIPLFVNDIQDLLVFSQIDHTFYRPRWCTTEKMNKLSKTVVLVIEGISSSDYMLNESLFPSLKNNFPLKVQILMPNAYEGNLLEELSHVPICPADQKKLIDEYKTIDSALQNNLHIQPQVLRALFPIEPRKENENEKLPETDRFSRTLLCLSAWQLVEQNFPMPMKGPLKLKYKDYIMTKDNYADCTASSPMYALDCEMCQTTNGEKELTRISIVNENLEVVYDTLVKPYNKITNYLTKFSGITKALLDPVTVRLEDVQRKVREILPSDAILVGQSLNFDLHAMKMMHPYIIDTSVIYNITGFRSKSSKLSTLSREFLNEKIQESPHGHCSTEDSSACMKLVKLKLANSYEFGDAVLVGRLAAEEHLQEIQSQNRNKGTSEKIFKVVGGEQLTTSLFFQIANGDKKVAAVGTQSTVNAYSDIKANKSNKKTKTNVRGYVADTNDNIIKRACEVADENDFLLTHIFLEDDEIDKKIKKINKWTKKMLKITPINGMCLVLLGNGANDTYGVCFISINRPIVAPIS